MQSELKSLSKIFSEVIFRIPDYQRGYSWEEKHLKDFWNDLEQLEESKTHYTGVLTLEPVTESNYKTWEDDIWIIDSKRYSPMYIVDGQQRLTTAVILLQVILDHTKEDEQINYTEKSEIKKKYIFETKDRGISKSYIFGYEKDNPSYEYLKQYIFCDESIQHSTPEETIYTKNLSYAKKYFNKRVSELEKKELEILFTKLTQNLQFNIFYIEKDLDVFVTFETMNNRGKPLSHLELLKNRLIYLSTKFNVESSESSHLRKAINESWKSIYHYLGKMVSKKFNDDDFLQTHYIFYFSKNAINSEEEVEKFRDSISYRHNYQDTLLDTIFSPKRLKADTNPLTIKDVFDYSQNIKALVKTYYYTAHPNNEIWTEKERSYIEKLNKLSSSPAFVLAMASNITVKPGKKREELLASLERQSFLMTIRGGYYFGNIDYLDLCLKLLHKKFPIEEATKTMNDLCEKYTNSQEFMDGIRDIGKSGGYYKWRAIRYFMYEYEQDLKARSKTDRELLGWVEPTASRRDDFKTTEHIYPQQANDPYWKDKFKNYTIKERNILKNSLGNLLPASMGKNSSLSNKSFHVKKGSEVNQVGYHYGCLSEIQVAMREDWDAKEILRRSIYLLEFMEKRWKINLGDSVQKAEILGLSFVIKKENLTTEDITFGPQAIPKKEINKVPLKPAAVTDDDCFEEDIVD